jgi:hypothetical protein
MSRAGPGHPGGAEGGIVVADREEIGDVQPAQRFDDVLEGGRRLGGVGGSRAQDGAPLEVDLGDAGDVHLLHEGEIAPHEPFEAVLAAEHPGALGSGPRWSPPR